MSHHRLVAGLGRIVRVAEDVVTGERDFVSINLAMHAESELGLARHPIHGEAVTFPFERLAGLKGAIHAHTLH